MARQLPVYEFPEIAFVVGSDPVVCIAPLSTMRLYMTVAESTRLSVAMPLIAKLLG